MSQPPDQRRFEADLQGGPFLAGVADGRWGQAGEALTDGCVAWPQVVLWVAAAPRDNSPDRFYLLLDCQGYPGQSPTGSFWDPKTRGPLGAAGWPKGRGQVSAVFRPVGAFYHPFDRASASGHPHWPTKHPHLIWDGTRTVVDYLSVIYELLNCSEYNGA